MDTYQPFENTYQPSEIGTFFSGGVLVIYLILIILIIVPLWRLFSRANKPGWAIIIPIYNLIVILQIAGKPIWWLLLYLIPIVNTVIAIIVTIDFVKSFGKGTGFGILTLLFPYICYPILGFGSAQYVGPGNISQPQPPQNPVLPANPQPIATQSGTQAQS